MLTTFKSPVHHDVVLFGDVAQALLQAMGLGTRPQGILRTESIPEALAALEGHLAAHTAMPADTPVEGDDDGEEGEEGEEERVAVGLETRALPLLELLRAALREGEDVSWESN